MFELSSVSFLSLLPQLDLDWTEKACREYGAQKKYYIPCLSQGLGISSFDGVYDYTSEVIRDMSAEMFGTPAE